MADFIGDPGLGNSEMMGGRVRAELNAKVKGDKHEKNYAGVGNGMQTGALVFRGLGLARRTSMAAFAAASPLARPAPCTEISQEWSSERVAYCAGLKWRRYARCL